MVDWFRSWANILQGGDNKLEITLLKGEPTVRCYGSAGLPGIFESCVNLMNEMDDNNHYQKFGTGADAEVQLPYTRQSSKKLCCQENQSNS